MILTAKIQWLGQLKEVGCLRVFDVWGQPPSFVATVRRRSVVVKLYAAKGTYTRETSRAIDAELISLGIKRVFFKRLNTKKHRTKQIKHHKQFDS